MEITDFTLRVATLATPGILACKFLEAMTGVRYLELWRGAVDALVYSLAGYVILATIAQLVEPGSNVLDFLSSTKPINFVVVGLATGLSVTTAGGWTWLRRRNLAHRLGNWLGLTSRISDDDVWSALLDPSPESGSKSDWYFVRDHARKLTYFGSISLWSDSGETRELLMKHVSVCDGVTGAVLYKTDFVYLALDATSTSIEAPSQQDTAPGEAEA